MTKEIFEPVPFDLLTRSEDSTAQAPAGFSLDASLEALDIEVEFLDQDRHLLWHTDGGSTSAAAEPGLPEQALCRMPRLEQMPGDRWYKCFEIAGPGDHLTRVRADVTELVRQSRRLEASNRRLNELSVTDGLTGLANRRYLDSVLMAEWQRATRNGTNLSLLMIDIDHFKSFNDQYGHVAGDECLRRVADVLRQCTRRSGELAARYGGEEFLLVLPGADRQHALEVAELGMRLVELEGVPHSASGAQGCLTISIGVACLQDHDTACAQDLIAAADAALYRAKACGRARYLMATTEDWELDRQLAPTMPAAMMAP